jgi:AraC family transcriptional regulator
MARGGLNLRKIVERIRVQSAADKLTRTSAPVMDIAVHVGYSSQQALTKAFKRFFGLSPSEYRQLTVRTRMSRGDPLRSRVSGHSSAA